MDEPGDREHLLACEIEEPCLAGLAQLADQKPSTITPDRMACIFRALGERKPGRYVHQTDHTFGDGSQGAQHVLIVRSDGSALYASATYEARGDAEPKEKDRPGQLCTLRDPSYFVDCLDAVVPLQQGDQKIAGLAWDCSYGDDSKLDWFESCEAAPAACE